jgi:hypothetical protein
MRVGKLPGAAPPREAQFGRNDAAVIVDAQPLLEDRHRRRGAATQSKRPSKVIERIGVGQAVVIGRR